MNEKVKCKKCNLLIDSDLDTCPYCGYFQHEKSDIKENNKEDQEIINEISNKEDNQVKQKEKNKSHPKRNYNLFDFEQKDNRVSVAVQISLFLTGWCALSILSYIIQLICLKTAEPMLLTTEGSGLLNFTLYFFLLGILILICTNCMKDIVSTFKFKEIFQDIGYGGILMVVSMGVNIIISIISKLLNLQIEDNANQSTIESIVTIYPFLSLVVFGFIGPICEEFTYRLGLFGLIKRKNRIAAYIVTACIFGLIHFDFTALFSGNGSVIVNEFLNLPSYISAGLCLCFIYEKRGFGGSCVAHMTNNVISILLTILSLVIN